MSKLNADVLAKLALAAARTARTHLAAAEYLLTGKFWPEAYAIAALGFEEAGKAWLAVQQMLSPEDPSDPESIHVRRLRAAYTMLTIVRYMNPFGPPPPDPTAALARVSALAREANRVKMRGLYADPVRGSVMSPADVSEHEAREMVNEVREVLDIGGGLIDFSTVTWAKGDQQDEAWSALADAAQAAKAGTAALEELFKSEQLTVIKRRIETVQSPEFLKKITDPYWLECILRDAASDAAAGDEGVGPQWNGHGR
jgi:AbiV family abortive infection protein